MKVSELIETLERNYNKDDHLVVVYWDKDWAEADLDRTLTADEWETIAYEVDIESDWLANAVSNAIQDVVDELDEEDEDEDED